jgi:uncharacterized protein (DUF1800 family)
VIPKGKIMKRNYLKPVSGAVLAMLISACGGGGTTTGNQDGISTASTFVSGNAGDANVPPTADTAPAPAGILIGGPVGASPGPKAEMAVGTTAGAIAGATTGTGALTPAAAAHFLAQASFGPTVASINALAASNKSAWINDQFNKPQLRHLDYIQQMGPVLSATGISVGQNQIHESFWRQAVLGQDQLRQRMSYALSQIFVISLIDGNLAGRPAGVASYYDMLGKYAFGNFRDLLQNVALHPMMGIYLSHLHNQKESGVRVPDENFAREIMQLMSIGLYQLNQDGTLKTSGGKPIETYTHDDVAGLAKVFTGWSWAGPDQTAQRFGGAGITAYTAREWTPMQMYPAYHSTSPKSFLGVNIGSGSSGEADLKIALDTLFNHPNVGPFIGRQLIQRLVSSNPSPAYVGRVAAAFANNGAGVRGDMRAVIRAVLLDPEAADNGSSKKLREPVLRLANWMRAFNATSATGRFPLGALDDPLTGLSQTVLRSPSVFNFYRPQYTPPNTALATANMVAPEMQITGEPSVTGYLNYMQTAIPTGVGGGRDVQANYATELALAPTPDKLVDHLKLLLLDGAMSTTLRNQIIGALNSIVMPKATGTNTTQIDSARKSRVYMAIYLTMASPEYLAQR